VKKPEWSGWKKHLKGTSKVVANDAYELVLACNGRTPVSVSASTGDAVLGWKNLANGIAVLILTTATTTEV